MTARKLYRVPAFLAVLVALVAGLFLLGRVSDNATVSMGLTALWFGLVFVVAAALALRIRILRWPLAIGYAANRPRAARPRETCRSPLARFYSIAHESTGKAAVVELTSGARGDVQIARYSTVVVWCRAFSVSFMSAPLERA